MFYKRGENTFLFTDNLPCNHNLCERNKKILPLEFIPAEDISEFHVKVF